MSRVSLLALVLALLGLSLYWAQQQWRYQRALSHGDAAAATRIWPTNAEAWRMLSQQWMFTDAPEAERAARRAIADDGEDWNNWAALATVQAESGNLAAARVSMRQMAARTMGYQGHWRYANLLLLAGDPQGFWPEAEQALRFAPPAELPATLNQVWQVANGDLGVFDRAVTAAAPRNAALPLGALGFLLDQGRVDAAGLWWQAALASAPTADLVSAGNRYLELLVEAQQPSQAGVVWREGLRRGVFAAADGPTAGNAIASGNDGALGWSICTSCGPWVTFTPGLLGFEFHGDQGDTLVLAHQWLLLAPDTNYRLDFRSSFQAPLLSTAPEATGVHVKVVSIEGAVLADAAASSAAFTTPSAPDAYQLQLVYQRPLGQMPLRGTVQLSQFTLAH